jgi:nucleotide-binding universal stress UspA family protein
MTWARILAPLSGSDSDSETLAAACALAHPFSAEVMAAYAPVDPADILPWSDGFLGGAQMAALESLKSAADAGEAAARASFSAASCGSKRFVSLNAPVWAALSDAARLTDVVVFPPNAGRGPGALNEAFQQILMEERRPILAARGELRPGGVAVIPWDGGRESSRAARAAIPWLLQASEVHILIAPASAPNPVTGGDLQAYLACHRVRAAVQILPTRAEPAPLLLDAAHSLGAQLIIAGAYGVSRFRQFIFGGATMGLLHAEGAPSLLLSH